ncbi:MAG: hypothetical protein BWY72_01521 [Bacteroidetes bacterium ADurb.Bin416]|nr:MAG: hypothetical protein BWY72_01521 [Bacteroidetes bacterium ADurb.Bin416]
MVYKTPLWTVGEPIRMAFDLNISVIKSLRSVLEALNNFTFTKGSAIVMPLTMFSASIWVPLYIVS